MSYNFTNNEAHGGSNSNRKAAPIPIGSSSSTRGGIGLQMSGSNQFASGSHMAQNTSGIDAPPNSLAAGPSMAGPTLPSSINFKNNISTRTGAPDSFSVQHGGMSGIGSGFDAPPNSLAAGPSMAGPTLPSSFNFKNNISTRTGAPESFSGQHGSISGIGSGFNAPPNSLAAGPSMADPTLPSSFNFKKDISTRTGAPESYSDQRGTMAPPNSFAQSSRLTQTMENKDRDQVLSGSLIDRRFRALDRVDAVDEADENAMDQDQDNSMDDISPASFHGTESDHMSSRYNEDMFQME